MDVQVKICGIRTHDALHAAVSAGADWIGFNFVPASPRAVTIGEADLLLAETGFATGVALVADADNDLIDAIRFTGFPIIQLHGSETPERVAQIKARTDCKIWKAIGVSAHEDLHMAGAFDAADRLLIDARPPQGAAMKGGHGSAFDWSILDGWDAPKPWILAGGLTPSNIAQAIRVTSARAVDVSSGVERARGVKDGALVEAFIRAVKEA